MNDVASEAVGAAARWAELLGGWGIPEHVARGAPQSPWGHDTAAFVVDDTLDPETASARAAREVLPHTGGSVLDIGCGGGRSSLVLVPPADRLIGVDPDAAMLKAFAAACERRDVACAMVAGRWPDVAESTPPADIAVCHHVLYDVADVVPFLQAMTAAARLAVVVEVSIRHPMSAWSAAWRHFWDVERPVGPTSADLCAVLDQLGLAYECSVGPRRALSRASADPARLLPMARRRLCLTAEHDDELAAFLAAHPPDWVDDVATIRWPGDPT